MLEGYPVWMIARYKRSANEWVVFVRTRVKSEDIYKGNNEYPELFANDYGYSRAISYEDKKNTATKM